MLAAEHDGGLAFAAPITTCGEMMEDKDPVLTCSEIETDCGKNFEMINSERQNLIRRSSRWRAAMLTIQRSTVVAERSSHAKLIKNR